MDIYQPYFLAVYRSMGSKMPIHVWTEVIGKNLPMFASESQIYNPATIRVRMTSKITDPEGVVQLDVPLTEKNWYAKLTSELGAMMGASSAVDVVDEDGCCIRDFTFKELRHSGDLEVVDKRSRQRLFVDRAIAPPRHMASDKHKDVVEWFADKRHELSDVIVKELVGKDMATLVPAVAKDGPVQRAVEEFIADRRWPEFCKTYARDDGVRALDPRLVARQVAFSVLNEVRHSLRASQNQIKTYFAHQKGGAQPLWDSKIATGITRPTYKSDVEMFEDIADDALEQPQLERKVYHIISAGTNVGCRGKEQEEEEEDDEEEEEEKVQSEIKEHPLDIYYHGHHYRRFGRLPGHVISEFVQPRVERKLYPGDPIKALNMFQLFSGRHQMPAVDDDLPPPLERVAVGDAIGAPARQGRLIPIRGPIDLADEDGPPALERVGKAVHELVDIDAPARKGRLIPIRGPIDLAGEDGPPPLERVGKLVDIDAEDLFADERGLENDEDVFIDDLPFLK